MIRQITLKCFRQHEDRTFTFAEGLNAIKGANEAGKTTLAEAALYALFGAKTLRDPLADVVTWGRKETELRVELTIEINGRLFNFKRGKSGAECEYDGGLVTGQNEVSSFAAEVLGGDATTTTRLMMASQNNLRGALEEGPKAVATQIETLADFDLFDRIIEAAQEKWTLGSSAMAEDRLKVARETLSSLEVTPPDLTPFTTQIEGRERDLCTFQARIDALIPTQRAADSAVESAQTVTRMYEGVVNNLRRATEQRDTHIEQRNQAEAASRVTVQSPEPLKQQLAEAEGWQAEWKVFCDFKALRYPEVFWEGTRASFEAEQTRLRASIEANQEEQQACSQKATNIAGQIKILKSKIITSLVCPTCNQDLKNRGEVELQNKRLENEVASLQLDMDAELKEAEGYAGVVRDLKAELSDLIGLAKVAQPFETFAVSHGRYVTVDTNLFPPKLAWKGAEPTGNLPDAKAIRDQISQLEKQEEDRKRAEARVEALTQTILEDNLYIERLTGQKLEFGEIPNLDELKENARTIGNGIATLRIQMDRLRSDNEITKQERASAEAAYAAALARRQQAEAQIVAYQQELDQLNFNNALLKKIKSARPIIADKLWSMVLTSVSTMFSQMRGEKSVVTKDKDGFKVNGKSVTSFSGSTLDLLGLAIRVALVKTFLPNTSFVLLDEPSHGCDEGRTAAMLGYLGTVGFRQTIIISHEEATEAAASHVVQL